MTTIASEKSFKRLKRLSDRMREGEQPLFTIPAFWENREEKQTQACDLVVTNQRVFGYIYTTFPRERLFMDTLELEQIKTVSIRQKTSDMIFRELLLSDGQKKVLVRGTRRRIEEAFTVLRSTIGDRSLLAEEGGEEESVQDSLEEVTVERSAPVYERKKLRQSLERSPQGLAFLLAGGLLLEVLGVATWAFTGSLQIGGPLFLAGIIAVVIATVARRQMR